MLSVRCITILTLLLAILLPLHPQESKNFILRGNIYNKDSLDHLPYVTISINGVNRYVSDEKGYFQLKLLHSDTIEFKCTGYETVTIFPEEDRIPEDTIILEVLMKTKIYDIPEAEILPWKNYEEFRSALISNEQALNADIANRNLNLIMLQNKQNMGPEMDGYSNYRNQMKMKDENNNAFIILSTEPGKGLYYWVASLFKP